MKKLTKHFTLIELMIVVAIIAVIATIAVPQLLDARRNSNERACIGSLRSMNTDQETYKSDNTNYATLAQLRDTGKVNLVPLVGGVVTQKAGYLFTDLIAAPTADNYAALGTPSAPGSTGKKLFAITNTGTVRTDPAVVTGFLTSNAAGIAAIAASTLNDIIAAGSEQAGVDAINLFAEGK